MQIRTAVTRCWCLLSDASTGHWGGVVISTVIASTEWYFFLVELVIWNLFSVAESPGRCFVWNIFIAPVCRGYGQVNDDPPQGSIYLSWVLISPGKCSSLGFFSYFSFTFPFLPKAHLKLPWRVDWQVPKGRSSVSVCFLWCLDHQNHYSFPNFLSVIFLGHWFPALITYFWHERIRNHILGAFFCYSWWLFCFYLRVCAGILSDQGPS